ncbi:hypothetical protein FACS18949_13410 [Clostridia bacterium]|nr:hypothetical protein FACS189425_06870 [Clostridia bacterium]GHV35434.1 hypothetical protein FACS18949_13410 [Clostridia bacterium]
MDAYMQELINADLGEGDYVVDNCTWCRYEDSCEGQCELGAEEESCQTGNVPE